MTTIRRGALLEAVSQVLPSPPQPSGPPAFRRCIDLGCGTGLMGPLVRPYVGYLEGREGVLIIAGASYSALIR
jgi:predicted TPR repeat methyltransferase